MKKEKTLKDKGFKEFENIYFYKEDVEEFILDILEMFEIRKSYEIIYKKIKQKSGFEL